MSVAAVVLAAGGPITRDESRRAAARELAKQVYQQQRPSLVQQLLQTAVHELDRLLARVAGGAPGGGWGALVIVVLVIAVVAVLARRVGALRRSAERDTGFDVGQATSAAGHRLAAAAHAGSGRHAEAVRESLRAIARQLDERALVEPRAGRTANEVAESGAAVLPAAADELRATARLFDAIWYGGRRANDADSAAAAAADSAVRRAQPVRPGVAPDVAAGRR